MAGIAYVVDRVRTINSEISCFETMVEASVFRIIEWFVCEKSETLVSTENNAKG